MLRNKPRNGKIPVASDVSFLMERGILTRTRVLLCLVVVIGLTAACRKESAARAEFMKHCAADWTLTRWVDNGRRLPLPEGGRATLTCREDGVVMGRSFVNSYTVSAPTGAERLFGSSGSSTLVSSWSQDLMVAERQYYRLLRQMRQAQLIEGRLVLTSLDGMSRLEFTVER